MRAQRGTGYRPAAATATTPCQLLRGRCHARQAFAAFAPLLLKNDSKGQSLCCTCVLILTLKPSARAHAQVAPLMPFSMVCYFFGTSDCAFGPYAAGTALGVVPNVVFFCFVGASMKTMAEAAAGSSATSGSHAYTQTNAYWYYFWGSGFAAVAAVTLLTVAAKQHLDVLVAAALARDDRRRADRRQRLAAHAPPQEQQLGEQAEDGGAVAPGPEMAAGHAGGDLLSHNGSAAPPPWEAHVLNQRGTP